MGIKSINIAMGASYGAYTQKLTRATRQQLEQLGIPFDSNITESEGKNLIASHKIQQGENAKQEGFSQQKNGDNSLFERAKKLALKLGIAVNENIDFEQLLALIENKLEEEIRINKNNPAELMELNSLSRELSSIQAESGGSMGYDNTNQALLMSLEMLGQYNKNFLKK